MDNFADKRDFKLLEQDKYTFLVLRRILEGKPTLLLTDHERLILCFSARPYPVWIWTPDGAPEAELERAYRAAAEHSLLDGSHRFNLKYDLAEFFIKRAAAEGKALSVSMNMLAYECPEPIAPSVAADGSLHRCTAADADEWTDFMVLFHDETAIDQRTREDYRRDAQAYAGSGNAFFWKNAQGVSVASCRFSAQDGTASLGAVFTRPEYRRMHYAENLVYQVTKRAKDAGFTPTLYTDADYAASNACYRKIGYALRGKLCTVG